MADALEMMFREFRLPTMASRFAEMIATAEAQNWGYRKLVLRKCGSGGRRPPGTQAGAPAAGIGPALRAKPWATCRKANCRPRCAVRCPRCWRAGSSTEPRTCWSSVARPRQEALLSALGRELILRQARAVYFTPTFKLVQQLLMAKKDLRLDALLRKLDRFDAIILDDLGYVQQSQEEMEVLFTFAGGTV